MSFADFADFFETLNCSQPDLSGALFVEQSGTKKRERRADEAAQIILQIKIPLRIEKINQKEKQNGNRQKVLVIMNCRL